MKKTYMEPSAKVVNIRIKQPLLVALSGGDSEFGPGGEQPEGGTPVINSRRRSSFWDDDDND